VIVALAVIVTWPVIVALPVIVTWPVIVALPVIVTLPVFVIFAAIALGAIGSADGLRTRGARYRPRRYREQSEHGKKRQPPAAAERLIGHRCIPFSYCDYSRTALM
jgi:tetrahydromethanopterin S-methyltransferase subunit E